ncbi:MAG TPA: PLP-dependent lyase/thiolase [Actinomycetota bacterium]|nr:PLP-dependent lyase/thiolase [Actinomycetota bacterium]
MNVTSVVCAGCGHVAPPDEPYPFRCPNARPGDDIDHVLARELDPTHVGFPDDDEPNPFVRYRELFHSYHLGRRHGLSDGDCVDLVERLDKAVAEVDGRGFTVTPFLRSDSLSERLGFSREGGVWVKDETGNVSGSHKARHLMGVMVHLLVAEQAGLVPDGDRPDLAIASCGNAALAAAVVARAAERTLKVFVPTWADPKVIARLEELGAHIEVCPRKEGVAGDPAYLGLKEALAAGAVPFTVQGGDNGLAIEGGETLGYEMISSLVSTDATLTGLVVQVGGGALASSCIRAFEDAALLEAPAALPKVHTVQTRGAYPLKRAYDRVRERIGEPESPAAIVEGMRYARTHRSEFMWPWEEEPKSIATGILDDETYDWADVVSGMLATDGSALVVSEETLAEANTLAREATGIDVDATGSAGLAGLLELVRAGKVASDERIAVLFTGTRR